MAWGARDGRKTRAPKCGLSNLAPAPPSRLTLSPPPPQGLLTNDVTRLAAPAAPPLYAALLTPAGKVVADLHLSRADDGAPSTSSPSSPSSSSAAAQPTLLADVDADSAPALLRLLAMYRLRAEVEVTDASDEWGVWWWRGGGGGGGGGEVGALPPPPPSLRPLFRPDPRGLGGLGWRAVLPHSVAEAAGLSLSSTRGADAGASPAPAPAPAPTPTPAPALLRAARFRLGVAEGAELVGLMPLEAGLDGLAGIAFDKGCYVGQELVARTHFRGEVRKRVVGFEGCGEGVALPEPGTALAVPGGGGAAPSARPSRPAGTVLAADPASGTGLALVRTAAALPSGEMEVEGGGGGRVRLLAPPWWPAGWAAAG